MPAKPRKRLAAALSLLAACGLATAAPALAAPETLELRLLGTTDVHGHIYPTNYYLDHGDEPVGLARAYTLIKRLRAENPNNLLVDSGDCLQGTPLTFHSARIDTKPVNPMVAAMNFMRYDAFAVGNHEYNYGIPYLMKARGEAQYPFLAGNIFHHGTDKPVFTPWIMKRVGGAKVAILGFTTPGVALWDRKHVEGKQDFRDIVASAKRSLAEAKAAGADAVVVIIHSGLGAPYDATFGGYSESAGLPEENVCAKLAETYPEIDAILLGHSHKDLPKLLHNGVLLAQAKKWGERLAVVDLKLQKQPNGRYKVVSKDSRTYTTEGVTPDAGVLAVAKTAHDKTVAYVNSVVGTATASMSARRAKLEDTPLLDFIQTVQRQAIGAELSSVSVFNDAAGLPQGPLKVADLAALYPYENTLTKVRVTGAQLKSYLEHSARALNTYAPGGAIFNPAVPAYNYDMVEGVEYAIDVRRPVGDRVVTLARSGKPVSPTDTFTMALNSYRQNGGGGYTMIKDAPVLDTNQSEIRELLIDYVKKHKQVSPEAVFTRNWRLLPEGAIAADGQHYR